MRVFNINKAIGMASSGVEYAQSYRRSVLADIDWVDDYYVFTDYMPTNLSYFSDRLGFTHAQVLWIYNLVTGRDTTANTLRLQDFLATIPQQHTVIGPESKQVQPSYTEVALTGSGVRYRIRTLPGDVVDRVEIVLGDQLIRVEHYDATLNNVEHFHENRLARRAFYTPGGRVGAVQFYWNREISRTLLTPASPLYDRAIRDGRDRPSSFRGDVLLNGRSQFFQYVFAHLFSEPDDVVIVDRALDVIDGIYPVIGDHRLYSVVHAEHYDLKQIEDGVLLWNNHYEHVFTRPDLVDGFIVSTERQKQVLAAQLSAREPDGFSVVCIPVGVAGKPAAQADYDRFALVTASRLAAEKHLDALIRAISTARARLPGLHLDIYGDGNQELVRAVIDELHAQEYVRLMGHHKLDGLLGPYGLYVSASTSEGFGLSLLEAMAEGLPIVGFDVDYGNREMVEPGVNGLLVPCPPGEPDADGLAEAIVDVLSSTSFEEMRKHSLAKAEAYTAAHVRSRWEHLLRPDHTERPC